MHCLQAFAFAVQTDPVIEGDALAVREWVQGLNVCKAAAGDGHTVVVTEGGDVYAWGRGKEGQLGLRDKYAAVL
jgi:alpha-tubulin suppressor-like RCC1 family protein